MAPLKSKQDGLAKTEKIYEGCVSGGEDVCAGDLFGSAARV